MLDRLESMLASHDWYHYMSDDSRAYARGREETKEINILMDTALIAGEGEKAAELMNKYNPNSQPGAFKFAQRISQTIFENGEYHTKWYTEEEWNER